MDMGDHDNIYAESPWSLLLASVDRRQGEYMYRMFMNMKERIWKKKIFCNKEKIQGRYIIADGLGLIVGRVEKKLTK
ncbi:hypothetical protein ACFQ4J_12805 [Laceyella tengchongensis]|jgi:hypothetical protein